MDEKNQTRREKDRDNRSTSGPIELAEEHLDQVTGGGQSHFPPGQFPGGNPANAHGSSNEPGNSGH
jgi:hypothetical protein